MGGTDNQICFVVVIDLRNGGHACPCSKMQQKETRAVWAEIVRWGGGNRIVCVIVAN